MASTNFQDFNQNTPITASWLNDANSAVYTPGGIPKLAAQSAAAWVRFQISGGVITINESSNVVSVVRTAPGVYVINYSVIMSTTGNAYAFSMTQAGFITWAPESQTSVTVNTTNTSNVAFDPSFVCVVVFGNN